MNIYDLQSTSHTLLFSNHSNFVDLLSHLYYLQMRKQTISGWPAPDYERDWISYSKSCTPLSVTYPSDKPLFLDLTVFLYNFYKAADLV